MKNFDIVDVHKKIGYVFNDWELLFAAFTHSSFANEHGVSSYERLEFLGDSIVNFVIAELLFEKYSGENEGFLTKTRAILVSTNTLGAAIDDLDIIEYMRTSGGAIQTEVLNSTAVKADLFEAITGAILVDGGGMENCKKFVLGKLAKFLDTDYSDSITDKKSLLYEQCAKENKKLIFRTVRAASGGFVSELSIDGIAYCTGRGTSKKKAEQNAADAFSKLNL